jgi:DNA-binding SARP family transcriptional activator
MVTRIRLRLRGTSTTPRAHAPGAAWDGSGTLHPVGTLEILLLGGFQLRRDGSMLDPIPLRAARSLFAYLILNRDRAHTRDLLAGLFWGDMPDSRARRRLSQALWQIQNVIGDEYLKTTAESVRFEPDAAFWLDADEFEWTVEQTAPAAVASRSEEADLLARAVDLYRGDLLAGFYDDWMIPHQERLRERFLGVLERLCDLTMARGDYENALIRARLLAQHDPMREEAHRRVMRVAVLLGRHNEAIRQYERCWRILDEELGAEPSPETTELYEATVADREAGGQAVPPVVESPLFEADLAVPFVGRDRERSLLVRHLDDAIDGEGSIVLLEGEAGVGKTRLMAEIAEDARWRGMDVLWGRASPSGGRPFGALAEALEAGLTSLRARQLAEILAPVWRDPLIPLLPALGEGVEVGVAPPLRRADEQSRMREAMTLAFQGLAGLDPMVVIIEDVHWAAEDTVQALAHLSGRVSGHPIVLVVSYRHAEARERADVWELLRTIDRRGKCERISLAPCTPAQTEELIRKSLGLPEINAAFSERLHRETGGIPLLILETLRALHEQGALDDAAASGGAPGREESGLPLTPAVHALLRHRLAGLTDPSKRVLDMVAIHDGGLALGEVVDASDLEDRETLVALDDLTRRRLIDEVGGRYAVGHELMRRVVYDDQTLSDRLDLHRRVALAIERTRPDQVEILAHHFTLARIPDRSAGYLERAAERAQAVHAYEAAAHHLADAVEALETVGAPPGRLLASASAWEEVLDTLGRRDDQAQALEIMEDCAPAEAMSDVHRRRAWWLAHVDRFDEATTEAQRAFDLARDAGDADGTVGAISALGMIACFAGAAAEGVVHLEKAASFESVGRRQEADARNALGQNLIDLQRFDEAESNLVAALSLYGSLDDKRGQAEVLGMLGMLKMERGETDAAEAHFRRAIEISTAIGYRHGEAVHQMNLGILHTLSSQISAAIARYESALAVYDDLQNDRGRALVLSNTAWTRHAFLGEDLLAEGEISAALEVYERIGDDRGRAQCLGVLGSIMARKGSAIEAADLFRDAASLAERLQDSWLGVQILKEWAASELARGATDSALAHAQSALTMARSMGIDELAVNVEALIGRVLLASGQVEEAFGLTSRAIGKLTPGVEFGHLVAFSHASVLAAMGRWAEADSYFEIAHDGLLRLLTGLSEERKAAALDRVPAHQAVVTAWRSRQPTIVFRRIASILAPSGRKLREDETVLVAWTVATPEDEAIPEERERRRSKVIRLCDEAANQEACPTVEDLAVALDVSVATIRRDLAALRASGEVLATRGSRMSAR